MKTRKLIKLQVIVLVIMVCFLLVALSFGATNHISAHAFTEESINCQTAENNYISFVKENNIEIPEEFIDSPLLGDLIKDIFETIEKTPDCSFAYSYSTTLNFAENIRNVFNALKKSEQSKVISTKESYTL